MAYRDLTIADVTQAPGAFGPYLRVRARELPGRIVFVFDAGLFALIHQAHDAGTAIRLDIVEEPSTRAPGQTLLKAVGYEHPGQGRLPGIDA